jgi:hypothetical protein
MTLAKYLLLLFFISNSVVAQQLSHPVMVSRDDAFSTPRQFRIVADTIDILAVMVQFQRDNTPLTSGDGRFDLTQGTNPIIEAPPHNKGYFFDHFTFVANYFRKASKGKAVVRATVLDSVITLPRPMQDYSPPRTGSTIAVGNLARDTWQKVDSAGLVPDFSQFECFVVLHAGIGRDIDLVSLLGYDPTPYDIPSLYIGPNGFRQYYGSDYPGIVVNGDTITNSIVIPESESRILQTGTGPVLLELSFNGLLCASVGNYLGLPDLFDTNTGRSGIGRFGLMDGQAIFSFKGVFPPEPSAWEKYWLGWIEPITLQAGEHTISLPAVSFPATIQPVDTVYRVPISAQEYYLVENRNRDPQRNGQRVTSTFGGGSRVQRFSRDTTGFNAFDIDSLAGVVTDVEDLDWSLPGGFDRDSTFFDGGVLIWHIDEAVIAQGLQANGVNANPLRRGVDLEEADGSQDIGQQYEFLSPGSGSEEGTALDFWYPGNGSPVNTNIFSPTSYPDSRSNNGANSHITIADFGPVVPKMSGFPRMTAKVKVGDDVVKLLPGFPKLFDLELMPYSLMVAGLSGQGNSDILVGTSSNPREFNPQIVPTPLPIDQRGKLYAWQANGQPVLPSFSSLGLYARVRPPIGSFLTNPSIKDLNGDGVLDVVVGEYSQTQTIVRAFRNQDLDGDSLADDLFVNPIGGNLLMLDPVIADSVIAFGRERGTVLFLNLNGGLIDSVNASLDTLTTLTGISRFPQPNTFVITTSDGSMMITARKVSGGSSSPDLVKRVASALISSPVVGVFGPGSSGEVRIAFRESNKIHLVDVNLNEARGFPVPVNGSPYNSGLPLALADVDGDGSRDIIATGEKTIYVINRSGAFLDNFPVTIPSSDAIESTPIVADVDGDGNVEVIVVSRDGLVVAYDRYGRIPPGFPLQAGTGYHSAAVFDVPGPVLSSMGIGLAVVSHTGSLSAWQTGSTSFPFPYATVRPWPMHKKDAQHSGLAIEPLTGSPLSSEFFPKSRAYNWPNPVYEGKTFIRYFVKDNATVNIKVFDLAGDLVATIPNPPGIGGVDNEIEWNVGDVQSGIYFARIEANGVGGNGVAVIKIAVVK